MEGEEREVDSVGHCFICLNKFSQDDNCTESSKKLTCASISEYLKLDFTAIINVKSNFKVELCIDCAEIYEQFSSFYRQLVNIEKEVSSFLQEIHDRMEKAESLGSVRKLRSLARGNLGSSEKIEILQKIRMDTLHKSKVKLKIIDEESDEEEASLEEDEDLNISVKKEISSPGSSDQDDDATQDEDTFSNVEEMEPVEFDVTLFEQPARPAISEETPPSKSAPMASTAPSKVPLKKSLKKKKKLKSTTKKERGRPSNPTKTNKLQCNECLRVFTKSHHLNRHINTVHKNLRHTCNFCGKVLSRQDHLKRHQQIAHNQCSSCGKVVPSLEELKEHIIKENCGQPFVDLNCDKCGKSFRDKHHLKRHNIESVHLKIKYICKKCTATFSSHPHLCRHLRNIHGLEPRKIDMNSVCMKSKSVSDDDNSASHHLGTTSEMPQTVENSVSKPPPPTISTPLAAKKQHVCQTCGNAFSKLEYLERHAKSAHSLISGT